jgi:O-antigen ligase
MIFQRIFVNLANLKKALVCFYALCLPLCDWYNIKINNLIIIILSALSLYQIFNKKHDIKRCFRIDFFILSSLFTVQILSIISQGSTSAIINALSIKLPLVLFPIIFSLEHIDAKYFKPIKVSFVIGCIISIIVSCRFILFENMNPVDIFNFTAFEKYLVLHRPYYGMYLLLALVFCLQFEINTIFKFLLSAAFISFIVIFQTKMSLVTLIILFFCYIFYTNQRSLKKSILFLIGGFLLFLFSYIILIYLNVLDQVLNLPFYKRFWILSIDTRIIYWSCAWEIFKENPILGVGNGNIQAFLNSCYISHYPHICHFFMNFNVHNEFLEEAVRHGVIGLFVYACFFLMMFRNSIINRNKTYSVFLIIILFASLTETLFSREQGVLMIAFFNTIFYYSHHNVAQSNSSSLSNSVDNSV